MSALYSLNRYFRAVERLGLSEAPGYSILYTIAYTRHGGALKHLVMLYAESLAALGIVPSGPSVSESIW